MTNRSIRFSSLQIRVLLACILAYTAAYLNRLNLSASLAGIQATLAFSDTQLGSFQTAFALVYAAGQLVSGTIVDRVPLKPYMLIGLLGSGLCNFLLSLSGTYGVILVLCMVNGIFQSMLWTPIVRMVASFFPEGPVRKLANLLVALSLVLGHLGAWSIAGWMSVSFGWRMGFSVPAVLTVPASLGTWLLIRNAEFTKGSAAGSSPAQKAASLMQLCRTGLPILLLGCVFYGFVRDGIVTWAPKTLSAMTGGESFALTLLIPLINVTGILGGFVLNRGGFKNVRYCTALMLCVTAVFCLLLVFAVGAIPTVLCMGLACACLYGQNPLITSLVPMEYDELNRVGLITGMIDSLIYVGSALSGITVGFISDNAGMPAVYGIWLGAALAGAAMIGFSGLPLWTKALHPAPETRE